ncbi:short chain dehydrogenase/reductase astE-like [Schistocerca americana]|uniref:short chain dehydrogenase/reductase astE-like n=1 Tax=Schistocerca americana TaxID=7009 RepID=UPI001F50409B|nr:short chain dehydrogenase/reductase astE-like [Schistocerca americana]
MGVKSVTVLQRAARALGRIVGATAALLVGRRGPDSLQGQVALVTGAGSSLGRELAAYLALCGCHLICVDDDIDAAAVTADVINAKVGAGAAEALACDLEDRQQVLQLSRAVLARHHAVHVLVLAAPPRRGADAYDQLAAQFWMALGLVPAMAARGGGRVLAVCREDCPGDAPSAHSVATNGLVEALSEQLKGTGVSLTCAYQYHFSNSRLPLSIPELSDEQVASEMVAALRRRQNRVVLPAKPLFWNSVLRSLHLVADTSLHVALCLDTPAPVTPAAPAGNAAKS